MVPEVWVAGRFGFGIFHGVVVLGVLLLGKRDGHIPARGGGRIHLDPA